MRNFKTLAARMREPSVRTGCFAYCAETKSCSVCTELLCERSNERCPFFKTGAQAQKEKTDAAKHLLGRMREDRDLRRRLKERNITEFDLRKQIEAIVPPPKKGV